jgi:hypothetical protein
MNTSKAAVAAVVGALAALVLAIFDLVQVGVCFPPT